MQGWDAQDETFRYVVHFSDFGAGPRALDHRLDVGDELREAGRRYEVERVTQPPSPHALGSAWVRLVEESAA